MKILLSTLLFLLVQTTQAQIPVGLKYDINGMPFNGYYDALSYSPNSKEVKWFNVNNFVQGYYYDKENKKISGDIRLHSSKISYLFHEDDYPRYLSPDELNSFVIAGDSFIVISNYQLKNKFITKPVFAKVLSKLDDFTFVEYYKVKRDIAENFVSVKKVILVQKKGEGVWYNFEEELHTRGNEYFGEIAPLQKQLLKGNYGPSDLFPMIKTAEYFRKFVRKEPLYLDKYWSEVARESKSVFTAQITCEADSTWSMVYYKDSVKLYNIQYSTIFPNVKDGNLTAYFPSGSIRKKSVIKNNIVKEVEVYDRNKKKLSQFKCEKIIDYYMSTSSMEFNYGWLSDGSDKDYNPINETVLLTRFDDYDSTNYHHRYENQKLISCFRVNQKDTIYQLTDPNYKFKLSAFHSKFVKHASFSLLDDALCTNMNGVVLIHFVIDPKGKVVDAKILNKIHPEIDAVLSEFLIDKVLPGAKGAIKFKSYKVKGEKQFCEFIVPISFGLRRFYQESRGYYNPMDFNMWDANSNYSAPSIPSYRPGGF